MPLSHHATGIDPVHLIHQLSLSLPELKRKETERNKTEK
jgi:hypothetical protein